MDSGRFLARLIWKILIKIYEFLRFILPWLTRVAGLAITLMLTTLAVTSRGMAPGIDNIASEIVKQASAIIPIYWVKHLYPLARFVAIVTVLIGWILLSYLTVWICGWVWSLL